MTMHDREPLPVDLPEPRALSDAALAVVRAQSGKRSNLEGLYETAAADPVEVIDEARRWEITDEGAADWAMRMYATALRRAQEIQEQAQRWHHQIQAWEDQQSALVAPDLEFFGDHLTRWGQARRETDPSTATLRLPSGDLETTRRKATPRVVDKDALLAWAQENRPAVVKPTTTYTVPAAEVKGLGRIVFDGVTNLFITDDGEEVPGVSVEPDRVTVVLRPATGGPSGPVSPEREGAA